MSNLGRWLALLLSIVMTTTSFAASTCTLVCCSVRFDSHCAVARFSANRKAAADAASHHCGATLRDHHSQDSAMRSMAGLTALAITGDPTPAIARPELGPASANLSCHRDTALALAGPSIRLSPFEVSVSPESAPLLIRLFCEQRRPRRPVAQPGTTPLALRI
jgi:hypothetical protein